MKVIIQCAASKNAQPSGSGLYSKEKRKMKFVAKTDKAPRDGDFYYAHPDDLCDGNRTWRSWLQEYNEKESSNPYGLLPAYRLYQNSAYEGLVAKFGVEKVFILSAGWGLIRANFLTPDYDITFSNASNVPLYARRRTSDYYDDFYQLPDDCEEICFLGGKEYQHLFIRLTLGRKGVKRIFYNSQNSPSPVEGYIFERFFTTRKTNWHYGCANWLIGAGESC